MNTFYLALIHGRRWITTQLEPLEGDIYTFPLEGMEFYKLFLNDDLLTEVFEPLDEDSDDQTVYYDALNNEIQVKTPVENISDKGNFILEFVIGFTNDKDMYWHINPDDSTTRKILYQGRFQGQPEFSQSQENNLVGILSISSSALNLINTDQFFNQFINRYTSFKDGEIKIWECTGSTKIRSPFYLGYISRLVVKGMATFSINDIFRRLDKIQYSRTDYQDSIVKSLVGAQPVATVKPIYKLFGRNSSFRITEYSFNDGLITDARLDVDSLCEATCVSYDPDLATNKNRKWITGIIEDSGTVPIEVFTITAVASGTGLPPDHILTIGAGYKNFTVGDMFLTNTAAGIGPRLGRIKKLGDVNKIVSEQIVPAPIVGDQVALCKISCLILDADGKQYEMGWGTHFQIDDLVPGEPIPITLNTNAESMISRPLNPVTDRIYFKMRNTADLPEYKHGKQILKLLRTEFSDDELDLDSFDVADAELALNLNYQVPDVSGQFPNKRELLERMLTTSFGYLFLDDNFKISYGNYTANVDTDEVDTISDIEISKDTMTHDLDYEDIYETASFKNEQFGITVSIINEQAKYLHKTNKTLDITSMAETFSTSLDEIITNFYTRIASYMAGSKIKTSFGLLGERAKIGEKKYLDARKKLSFDNGTVISTSDAALEQQITLVNITENEGNFKVSVNGGEAEEL